MPDQNHAYQPRPCTSCSGNKGSTKTYAQNGKIVQVWVTCRACGGKGVR